MKQFVFPFIHLVVLVSFTVGMPHERHTLKERDNLCSPEYLVPVLQLRTWKARQLPVSACFSWFIFCSPTQWCDAQACGVMVSTPAPQQWDSFFLSSALSSSQAVFWGSGRLSLGPGQAVLAVPLGGLPEPLVQCPAAGLAVLAGQRHRLGVEHNSWCGCGLGTAYLTQRGLIPC